MLIGGGEWHSTGQRGQTALNPIQIVSKIFKRFQKPFKL
jgi:hypothetical protein